MKPYDYKKLTKEEKKDVREKYILHQKGKCYFCKEPLENKTSLNCSNINYKLFPKSFFNYPIHLHHNHKTGLTIGAVHCHCNALLWQLFNL